MCDSARRSPQGRVVGRQPTQCEVRKRAKAPNADVIESARFRAQPGENLSAQARFLLSLQRTAGNRAVHRLVRRSDEATGDAGAPAQRRGSEDEELQSRSVPRNDTGLPDGLKSSIEFLSGMSMDAVRVHYNSSQPAQVNAVAYAQGSEIHVASGQERHLPHEAWHVVQQAEGRVPATTQLQGGVATNDDAGLEQEADAMGAKALAVAKRSTVMQRMPPLGGPAVMQRALGVKIRQRPRPAAFGFVLQAKLPDGSDYTNAEKREAIADVQGTTKSKKTLKAKDAAAAMAEYLLTNYPPIATNYKNKAALVRACTEWWNKPSLVAEPKAAEAPRHALVEPRLEYDAEHGDLHFIAKPTDKKSAWSLEKGEANQLVEDTIRQHLRALGEHSAGHEDRNGWSAFYITAQHDEPVGTYVGESKRGGYPTTDHFTIQLQVNYRANEISYHGFPDERIEGQPLGCSINKTDKTKL